MNPEVAAGPDQARRRGVAAPAQQILGRGPERDVHGLELLHRGEQIGRAGDPGAHLEARPAHPARDLGPHDGILAVLAGFVQRRLGRFGLGPRVVHLLLGHRLPLRQGLQPGQRALGVRQSGGRAAVGGVVPDPLQPVEHVAGLHEGALGEGTGLDDAVHPGPHFDSADRLHLSDELVAQGKRARRHRHHPDLGRWRRGGGRSAIVARGSGQRREQRRQVDAAGLGPAETERDSRGFS